MRRGPARHRSRSQRSLRPWLAAAGAACAAAAVALAMTPAQAATTVPTQLTLSGVASPDNPTGGSVVGVHPGDSVVLTASALPSAGAPGGLGGMLSGLLGGAADLQVKITASNVPGLPRGTTLDNQGKCGGARSATLTALRAGTYTFDYEVAQVTLLSSLLGGPSCRATAITPPVDQLGKATGGQLQFTDTAQYIGRIVVADSPPRGQIGLQLPKQSISAKAGPVHTSVNLPGASVGVPNPLPAISSALGKLPHPGLGGTSPSGSSGRSSTPVNYTPPPLTVPEQVMPHAVAQGGSGGSGPGFGAPADTGAGSVPGYTAPAPAPTDAALAAAPRTSAPGTGTASRTVELSSQKQFRPAQLPVLLAILAILALGTVTAGYARSYLSGRHRP